MKFYDTPSGIEVSLQTHGHTDGQTEEERPTDMKVEIVIQILIKKSLPIIASSLLPSGGLTQEICLHFSSRKKEELKELF